MREMLEVEKNPPPHFPRDGNKKEEDEVAGHLPALGMEEDFAPEKPHVLLLGTRTAEFIFMDERGILDVSLNLQESRHSSEFPEVDPSRFDLVVMNLTLRHVLLEATKLPIGQSDLILANLDNNLQAETLLADCTHEITFLLNRLHQKFPALPVFITSILAPCFNFLGDLIGRNDLIEPRNFVRVLNKKIYNLIETYNNFHFVEMNEIVSFVGGEHIRDDRFNCMSNASFLYNGQWLPPNDPFLHLSPEEHKDRNSYFRDTIRFRVEFWSKISTMLAIIRQERRFKMIIVDLDDTLWKGVAADDTMPVGDRIEGWPLGFVEALIFFKKRGGLLAICSKNDHKPTLDRMATIWNGAIQPKDFASIQINWQPKPENIAKIFAETMILPENTLFIDDNPREIDEVQTRFPGIECLMPPQEKWRRIILQDARFQTTTITKESRERTKLVQAIAARTAMAMNVTREEWLQSLEINQKIHVISKLGHEKLVRIFELINKTNQFNTTGKRWYHGEFDDFFARGGICIATSVKDRTADNGVVGAALVMGEEIVQLVLSCRVFGLGIEIALGSIATQMAIQKSGIARAKWIDTGKNFTCHDFFEKIGFVNRGDFYESQEACDLPPWIALEPD